MSIRVSQRRVSDIEYENTFYQVHAYICGKAQRLPKRHMHYIGEPISRDLNGIYQKIMKCTDLYLHSRGRSAERGRLCAEILRDLQEVQAYSYFWWNIGTGNNGIKYQKRAQREPWAELVNKEQRLLLGVASKCRQKAEAAEMHPYQNWQIKGVTYLEKLAQLQRIVYHKAISLGKGWRDAQMEMLVQLTRDAFYNAIEGNYTKAEDEKSYKIRRRWLSEALNSLYAMSRPVRELAFCDIWSEQELAEICETATDCISLIKAVQASDRERFKTSA